MVQHEHKVHFTGLPLGEQQASAVRDILNERITQDALFGVQNHHPAYWLAILGKQVGQLGSAVLGREWFEDRQAATAIMRKEAVQAAAVALALIECIDRGEMPDTLTTSKPSDPRQLSKALDRGHEALDYEKDAGPSNGFYYVDSVTHKPCPTRGALLCTIDSPDHRHVAGHMVDWSQEEMTCYHCDLPIRIIGRNLFEHVSRDAYEDWVAAQPHDNGRHEARFEPHCVTCGRDNANGTHDALQRGGHLNHSFKESK